jgi:hypothetical protein
MQVRRGHVDKLAQQRQEGERKVLMKERYDVILMLIVTRERERECSCVDYVVAWLLGYLFIFLIHENKCVRTIIFLHICIFSLLSSSFKITNQIQIKIL